MQAYLEYENLQGYEGHHEICHRYEKGLKASCTDYTIKSAEYSALSKRKHCRCDKNQYIREIYRELELHADCNNSKNLLKGAIVITQIQAHELSIKDN